MGGFVNTVANVVAAPVKAVSSIVSGGNVISSVAQAAGTIGSANTALTKDQSDILNKTPVVGAIVNTVTANGLNSTSAIAGDITSVESGGSAGNIGSDALNFGKSAAVVGAEIATAGALAPAAGGVSVGSVAGGLGSGRAVGQLFSGNLAQGASSLVGSFTGYDTSDFTSAYNAANGIYNDIKPIGVNPNPANLGPFAPSTADGLGGAAVSSLSASPPISPVITLSAAALALWLLSKKGKAFV